MKYLGLGLFLGSLCTLLYCDKCGEATPADGGEISTPADSGAAAPPTDAGSASLRDSGVSPPTDGSVHIFDAAHIDLDASSAVDYDSGSGAEAGVEDVNHG